MGKYIIGISGASGAVFADKLIRWLSENNEQLHIIFSKEGLGIFNHELRLNLTPPDLEKKIRDRFKSEKIFLHDNSNFFAPVASGSFQANAMVIVPCSMKTAGGIANGITSGLIERTADVTIKEKRKLIIIPRETPLSSIHLKNLLTLSRANAVVIPPAPGFYNRPETIDDIVNFIVGKILDQLGIEHNISKRWGEEEPFAY